MHFEIQTIFILKMEIKLKFGTIKSEKCTFHVLVLNSVTDIQP